MKKLLVIAFATPPVQGHAVGRALHLARRLPEFGWEAIVLTPRHPRRHFRVERTREHRIYRIPLRRVIDPEGSFWLQETGYSDILFGWRQSSAMEDEARSLPGLYGKSDADPEELALEEPPAPRTFTQAVLSWIRCDPDARAGWILPGLSAARAISEAMRPDAVYSVSPPVSAHRIAMRVAENLGIPWIADLQEPWQGAAPGPIDRWRCRRILNGARVYRLPPSFDPADLPARAPSPTAASPLVLVHAGRTEARGRDPRVLLDAIRLLLESGIARSEDLRVRMLGARDRRLSSFVASRFLSGVVTLEPTVPWYASLETQAEAAAVLAAVGPGDSERIPNRVMEAFSVRRPLLVFGPAGDPLTDLLRRTGGGSIHPDCSSLANALADLLLGRAAASPAYDDEELNRFDAQSLARRVVDLIAGVAPRTPAQAPIGSA